MSTFEAGHATPLARPGGRASANDHEPYRRTTLLQRRGCEIVLLRWRAGMRCAPHDHGYAAGTVYLVRGRFVERTWRKHDGALEVIATRTFVGPCRVPVGAGDIHDMYAVDGGVSLHVYRPSIQHMRVFDLARRETLTVADDCGAWVPSREDQVIARERW